MALALSLATSLSAQRPDMREDATLPPALDAPKPAETEGPVIKLALLLDTSNSMDGLINQARTRLWQVVNEMGKAEVEGAKPQLQVALFQYGNNRLEASDDYVQLRCPFTTDLDIVSEQLFSLATDGGSEYCGAVIRESVQRLDWGRTSDAPTLRVIVIAGNEPFNQGTEPYVESISTATGLKVRVNTIFCGNREEGRRTLWADGAQRGNGYYAAIDQDQAMPEIETPFDDAIRRLNDTLNGTYLGYGRLGREAKERQVAQDAANSSLSASAGLFRMAAKTTASYEGNAVAWDLVAAVESGEVDLADLDESSLPERLRGNSVEENRAILEALRTERVETSQKIRELSAQRAEFIAAAQREAAQNGTSLDDALINALREQATSLGFVFGEE